MENKRPIVEALQKFIKNDPLSFHVPGHKNGLLSNLPMEIKKALLYDVTELTGLDDFHKPEEAIFEAEKLLAKTYGAEKSFFLVNGSTVGNLAMIYATCQQGDTVIVQRNAHKSIFHAIELVKANPIYIAPEWHEQSQTAGSVQLDRLVQAINLYPNAKAVVLTHPTYYGVITRELKRQISYCHGKGIPVLVDEAHGAHLTVSNQFPASALELGADIVVQSAHKTLPAMTMASFLHINSTRIDANKVNYYLRMLQSSSPSYLLLASLDDARQYVTSYQESDFFYLKEKRGQLIESLQTIKGLEVIEVDDLLKLILRVPGMTGFELKLILEKVKVFVELADTNQVLLVLPLLKKGDLLPFSDLNARMKEAEGLLKEVQGQGAPANQVNQMKFEHTAITKPELNFDQIESAEKEWISFMQAFGRIAATTLIPYPPGIPLFIQGEKITATKLSQLEGFLEMGATFQGEHRLQEKLIYVIK